MACINHNQRYRSLQLPSGLLFRAFISPKDTAPSSRRAGWEGGALDKKHLPVLFSVANVYTSPGLYWHTSEFGLHVFRSMGYRSGAAIRYPPLVGMGTSYPPAGVRVQCFIFTTKINRYDMFVGHSLS